MTTFAVTDPEQTLAAVNYLLSNLGSGSASGNVTIPGNVLVANTTTGIISNYGNTGGTPYWFQYQYINLRYANSPDGSLDFSIYPANTTYFGIYNSTTTTPAVSPAAYNWNLVAGGFSTTKTIFYSAIGGRQVQWAAANSAPSSDFVESVANVAINLDVVTTAAGTPGQRGPIAMAYVVTPSDPNLATSATLTAWFSAPRDAVTAPIGTGLIPVPGDTANFVYSAGAGAPNATFTYNGSIWVPAYGQVVDGNVIVRGSLAGNALIANTITGNLIAASTITGNLIAANTIAGNNIIGNTIAGSKLLIGTITGNLVANNTLTAAQIANNTLTSNQIVNGTITATQIANGTITTTNIAAGTIRATNIAVGANITGNMIAAGTITATNLAANTIIVANSIQSNNATFGSNTSAGFWLDATTGNVRFGGNTSIGNNLTVGNNVTIGNNTVIGGNLTVNGLINSGALVTNSVNTNTLTVNSVTLPVFSQTTAIQNYVGTTGATYYTNPFVAVNITTTHTAQIYLSGSFAWNIIAPAGGSRTVTVTASLVRSGVYLNPLTATYAYTGTTYSGVQNFSIYVDGYPIALNPTTYGYQMAIKVQDGGGSPLTLNIGPATLSATAYYR